jgi:hypothetical protein
MARCAAVCFPAASQISDPGDEAGQGAGLTAVAVKLVNNDSVPERCYKLVHRLADNERRQQNRLVGRICKFATYYKK